MRWQLLFAVTGFGLVLALLGYHVQAESRLCSQRFAASGGIFFEGLLGAPASINPLLGTDNPVDRQLVELVFDGLTRYEGQELVPALAETWQISDDGRTVRFALRDDVTWHDGEPFSAADVAYTYGLMQEEDFTGDSALKRLWQSVVIREISPQVIEFELREPYAGFLDATTTGILPAHLLSDVSAAALAATPFNQSPVGTGPFELAAGQNWQVDNELLLTPHQPAWPEGTRVSAIGMRFYPTEDALVDAFARQEIQAINGVTPTMMPAVAQLPEVRLFTSPANTYSSLIFNMGEGGSDASRSSDTRRALAYGLDRERIIDQALNGQGVVHHGPYLPNSWAYKPDLLTLYSSNIVSATTGLEAAGWLQTETENIRQKDGERLMLRFLVFDSPSNRAVAREIEAQWNALGAAPLVTFFTDWREFRGALDEGNFDVALLEIRPLGDPDLYDFWSQEAIIRGQNYAGWNRRRASEALEQGRQLWSKPEREPFYATFLRFYDEDLPELALFQHIYTYAVHGTVEGVAIGRIDDNRDRFKSLDEWVMAYQDFAVLCPDDQA